MRKDDFCRSIGRLLTPHKLNSIGYGPGVLALIGFLTLAAPATLYLGSQILKPLGLNAEEALRPIIVISIAVGLGLLAFFILLLAIELAQDRYLDNQYRKTRNRKVKISDEYYECQYCGYQKVRGGDTWCRICGKSLR